MKTNCSSRLVSSRLARRFSPTILAGIIGTLLSLEIASVSANEAFWVDKAYVERSSADVQKVEDSRAKSSALTANLDTYRVFSLYEFALKSLLSQAVRAKRSVVNTDQIKEVSLQTRFPLPDGSFIDVSLVEDSLLSPELEKQFPQIKSYMILPDNKRVSGGSVTVLDKGVQVMIMLANGDIVYIDPEEQQGQRHYVSYSERGNQRLLQQGVKKFFCGAGQHKPEQNLSHFDMQLPEAAASSSSRLLPNRPIRTYRLAIAATSPLERVIPQLTDLVNRRRTDGEVLPWRPRTAMKFRLTARDGLGGVNNAYVSLRVVAVTRPFRVTQPAGTLTATYLSSVANKYKVRWDVADTNISTGVNCQRVDIGVTDVTGKFFGNLSTGLSVPNTPTIMTVSPPLAEKEVTIPASVVTSAGGQVRIRVKCSTSLFFGLSGTDPAVHLAQ